MNKQNILIPGKLYKANKCISHYVSLKTVIQENEIFMLISQLWEENTLFVGPVAGLETITITALLNNKILKVKAKGYITNFVEAI